MDCRPHAEPHGNLQRVHGHTRIQTSEVVREAKVPSHLSELHDLRQGLSTGAKMSSHSVDPGTQKAASASSQATDAALAAQANQNTQFAQQTRNALFGTPNASGQMTGGSLSAMTNPGSLLFSGLTGPYNSQYQQSADITNKQDQNQLATQRQSQANRGFSKTPSGFDADQELQTRLAAAAANGSNYATLAGKQYQDTLNNFWNANNLMAGQSASANSSAIAANSAAASNYANLYGTASQQVQNPWMSALQGVG